MAKTKYKYLATMAVELDGHAESNAFYVESDNVEDVESIFKKIMSHDINDIVIENVYDKPRNGHPRLYGVMYGDMYFAFTLMTLEHDIPKNTLYRLDSRTG